MAQHSMKPPFRDNYVCQICSELLVSPVVLSCAHRFCMNCLGVVCDDRRPDNAIDDTRNWSRCPTCQKQQSLDPDEHRVDGVLKHFLKSHFGEPSAPKFPKPKKKKLNKGPVLDISFADCALQSYSTGIPFQPVPAQSLRANYVSQYGGPSFRREKMQIGRSFRSLKQFKQRSQRKSKKQVFQQTVQSNLARSVSNKNEAYAYTQADMKPASCHQCKSNKLPIHLLFCSSGRKKKGQRSCHKKFCDLCLQRYSTAADVVQKMSEQRQFKAGSRDTFVWTCPACLNICTCAGCKRKTTATNAKPLMTELEGLAENKAQMSSASSSLLPQQNLMMPMQMTAPMQFVSTQPSQGVVPGICIEPGMMGIPMAAMQPGMTDSSTGMIQRMGADIFPGMTAPFHPTSDIPFAMSGQMVDSNSVQSLDASSNTQIEPPPFHGAMSMEGHVASEPAAVPQFVSLPLEGDAVPASAQDGAQRERQTVESVGMTDEEQQSFSVMANVANVAENAYVSIPEEGGQISQSVPGEGGQVSQSMPDERKQVSQSMPDEGEQPGQPMADAEVISQTSREGEESVLKKPRLADEVVSE
eukprot:759476_1